MNMCAKIYYTLVVLMIIPLRGKCLNFSILRKIPIGKANATNQNGSTNKTFAEKTTKNGAAARANIRKNDQNLSEFRFIAPDFAGISVMRSPTLRISQYLYPCNSSWLQRG
jgi:hypothetical protein